MTGRLGVLVELGFPGGRFGGPASEQDVFLAWWRP